MKKLLLSALVLLIAGLLPALTALAQTPQGINYQAVARNASGAILANQNICVDVQITDGNGGTVLYTDGGNIITNQFGLFTLNIGSGDPSSFANINWGGTTPWLHVRIDIGCTSVYADMGTSRLLSVPYALNALNSATSSDNNWIANGNTISNLNTGNVGIGTAIPSAKLHVYAGDASLALFGPNPAGGMLYVGATSINQTNTSSAQVIASDGNLHLDPAAGHNIYIGYYQARDIYLNPLGGNVGIGTTSPATTLDIRGDLEVISNTSRAATFANNTLALDYEGVYGSCDNTPNYGYGVSGYGGYVGVYGRSDIAGTGIRIGTYGWAENGATAYGIFGTASGATTTNYAGYFSGDVYATGAYYFSDRKLKNDIKPLSDALSIINQLKPSVYTCKTNEFKQMHLPEGLQYGLIADEVQQVMPGAVKKAVQPAQYENHDAHKGKKISDEVEFNAVNYTEMIPVLIGAVKELNKKNEVLEKENMQLTKRIEAMEKK